MFSRLGDLQEAEEEDQAAAETDEDDDDSSVLQYAGVLKTFFKPSKPKGSGKAGVTIKAKATSSEPKVAMVAAVAPPPTTTITTMKRLGGRSPAGPVAAPREKKPEATPPPSRLRKRLGKRARLTDAQDSSVTSSRSKPEPGFRVTIKRTVGSSKVSSTTETPSAQMDNTGTVSVFKRLGRKTV